MVQILNVDLCLMLKNLKILKISANFLIKLER